ncbi:hypothetical protein ACTFPA_15895 [Bacillus cereus group sp. MYBK59-1]|uniref:Uncharacterized protein n=1 Tax=Bacillus thuringiensis serovar iberica TaxID=180866 RepID=A0A9X6QRC3_BACTU|nr:MULTISPECIES: hypothetical protein [Bacillus cereus group]HDR5348744.1 hypothetical protein [Bacillus thuringiensis]MCU5641338.1 hypothetical protein [Bacillus cereus]MEB9621083.1 hypothetical protein [Bacillus cereus]OUB51678.1 hypothetical protein BK741_07345 [Bacillus thuringiensis serovar iberica]SME69385.1 hypothetical protein BACERE00198_01051 [Bacillus cereus]
MNISVAKWLNNADAPVLFMIDDLANVWVDLDKNGKLALGGDWGFWKNEKNSSFRYLNEVILNEFSEVKVTFFVPVGTRVGMIKNPVLPSVSKKINADEETKKFFREIHEDSRFEIAYHGTTHGEVGETNLDFKQEWELFGDLEEAIRVIEQGKEIYKDAIGLNPYGGKYCGYTSNEFSDSSIDKTGFTWWCRYWNRGIEDEIIPHITGNDTDKKSNFDIKRFGENQVVDIPSTVNGALLTSVLNSNLTTFKGIAKKILKCVLVRKKLKEIDYLVENNLVISIQEHIAPSRDDGRIQTPNIFDDEKSLKTIFKYLKNKNIWYCTGTELAEYVRVRDNIKIIPKTDKDSFEIDFSLEESVSEKIITLIINMDCVDKIILPNGNRVKVVNQKVNIPITRGVYKLQFSKKMKW